MLQGHVRLDLHRPGRELQHVSERPVAVRYAEEQIGMLVVGRRRNDIAVRKQYLERQHRFMWQAAAKRARLDPDPGDGTADRDRLQLGHDERHRALRETGIRQRLVSGHAFDLDRLGLGVNGQDIGQRAHIEP